ncbi:BTB/POZ domain-containing protein 6-like [Phlebotomus argentipes]|uniref:BTB/POZ domain-containing protein 6-like n=1 Tax=Phlebotomus argentipes TaxID=94469 RepID=UPI0028930721|nr:BTB/POZ domain-containing protein 6-like [Phlebotomus argentipes]
MATASVPNTTEIWSESIESLEGRMSLLSSNEFLSDMVFLVGREKCRIPGHKLILSTCSWVFYNVFNNLKLDKDELVIEDVSQDAFLGFLKYCYTQKVSLDAGNVFDIFKLAQRFEMKHLQKVCEEHLITNMTKKTCVELYSKIMPLMTDSKSVLKLRVLSLIAHNFSLLLQDREVMKVFTELPVEALMPIVRLESLQCDEMELFDALMKWATNACRKAKIPPVPRNLRTILGDVFYMISFPAMKIEWFLEILAKYPEMLTPNEISNISLTIRGDVKSCAKFNHSLRLNDFVSNATNLEIPDGQLLPCCSSSPEILEFPALELKTVFKTARVQSLLGFAFIARKGQEAKITSCSLRQINTKANGSALLFGSDVPSTSRHVPTSIVRRSKLNWDFDLVIVRMIPIEPVPGRSLSPSEWHELLCTFDASVPHLRNTEFSELKSACPMEIQHLQIKKTKTATIPFLVFAH